jgi:tRNA (guanine37-N1)-methyltransferase
VVFHIITIFPQMIETYLSFGILARASGEGLINVQTHNLRDFAVDRYGHIDGNIFGGGRGMLYRPEPLGEMIAKLKAESPGCKTVYLTPQGRRFTNKLAREYSKAESVILITARYEGADARVISEMADDEISTGDYVLTGGELPALCFVDAVSRFVEGSIKAESADSDSFENGLLEYDHYTEPLDYKGLKVPDVLRGGNHQMIERFRIFSSLRKTYFNRPEMLLDYEPVVSAGATKDFVKQLKRKNTGLKEYLKDIEKISKEWKNGRRNSEQTGKQ